MNNNQLDEPVEGQIVEPYSPERSLIDELSKGTGRKYARFIMAALGAPWIGALAGLSAEKDQEKLNGLQRAWIEEHRERFEELKHDVEEIAMRLDGLGEETEHRVEAPEFVAITRSAFRIWDNAETREKREYIKLLIINAGATKLVADDLIRLFISWIDDYHESHFAVIKQVFHSPGITRAEIWDLVHNERPREDSAEADLFRYLIRDLSTGGIIRQSKQVTDAGAFMKSSSGRGSRGSASQTMESAFEGSKPYELTKLGQQFMHYVLSDAVSRIAP